MKKYVTRFVVMTSLIILMTGLFVWLTRHDDAARLSYVPDPDWSDESIVSPKLYSHIIDYTMGPQGKLYLAWVENDPKTGISELKYFASSPDQDIESEGQIITENKRIKDLGLAVNQEMVHIFWVGKGESEKLDLLYTRLDRDGQLIEQNRLLKDYFESVSDLDVIVSGEDNYRLVWSEKVEEINQIKTMEVQTSGKIKIQPTQLTISDYDSLRPKIIEDDKGRYHLTWREGYNFYYQSFNDIGENLTIPTVIDRVGEDLVSMSVKNNKLYLVWNKRSSLVQKLDTSSVIEQVFRNSELYGTVIDLEDRENFEIKQLTRKNGLSFNQTMVIDDDNNINLVYIDTYQNYLALTHKVYSADFEEVSKKARRIYPDQIVGSTPQLFKDPGHGLHLFWIESDLEVGNLHYANTINPAGVSPLALIGINENDIGVSSFMSIVYIISFPIFNLIFLLHIAILIILTLIVVKLKKLLVKKTQFAEYIKNPYFCPGLICLSHTIIYFIIGKGNWFFSPYMPDLSQLSFILIISTVACAGYIRWSRFSYEETYRRAGMLALVWLYWVNMINLIFYLPFMNY